MAGAKILCPVARSLPHGRRANRARFSRQSGATVANCRHLLQQEFACCAFDPPSFTPRRLAAARAALVRAEIIPASSSASARLRLGIGRGSGASSAAGRGQSRPAYPLCRLPVASARGRRRRAVRRSSDWRVHCLLPRFYRQAIACGYHTPSARLADIFTTSMLSVDAPRASTRVASSHLMLRPRMGSLPFRCGHKQRPAFCSIGLQLPVTPNRVAQGISVFSTDWTRCARYVQPAP
jgi:hypothetical protein